MSPPAGRGAASRARSAVRAAVVAVCLANGCASAPENPPPSVAVRSSLHRLGVTVRVEPPDRESRGPPTGVLEGIGEGAAAPWRRAAEGMSSFSSGGHAITGEAVVVLFTLGAAITVVTSAGGAVYGAFATVPEEDVERWMASFREQRTDAGADLGLAEALRRAVLESGTQVRPDDGASADATLEVVLREPVLVCSGVADPAAALTFEAEAELRPAGAAPVPLGKFDFVSAGRPFLAWSEADAPVVAELRSGARTVAEAIVDRALILATKDGR